MTAKLFAIHGSHPCAAVEYALKLKQVEYRTIELVPPAQVLVQPLLFRKRTVPAIIFAGGEKVVGSRPIMRRLDELVAAHPLLPADPAAKQQVLEAEEWGDTVLQSLARRTLWTAVSAQPYALGSFQEGGKIVLPEFALALLSPTVLAAERKLNRVSPASSKADLADLPRHLDRIDSWIESGVLGGSTVNAADLQIFSSVRLMLCIEDIAQRVDERPCGKRARLLFPKLGGTVNAGALPAEWLW